MILILDGSSQNTLRTCQGKRVFFEDNIIFPNAAYLNNCLKQIKLPLLLHTYLWIIILYNYCAKHDILKLILITEE